MQITCPNCDKKYGVDSSHIGEIGRNVQCSHCKHIWFAKPEDLSEPKISSSKEEKESQQKNEIDTKKEKAVKEEKTIKKEPNKEEEKILTKTVHETVVKNLPVVIEQDINEEIKEALIQSQKLNSRLSTMLFATNMLILILLIVLIIFKF